MIARLGIITVLCLPAGGCSTSSDTGPDLHPVKGTVTRNGQPVTRGYVRFMPADGQDLIVGGDVDDNGEFELETLMRLKKKKGAPAGTYTVTYMAPSAEVGQVTTVKRYTLEAKSNEFAVELVEKRRK
jgi:hypothetical protein